MSVYWDIATVVTGSRGVPGLTIRLVSELLVLKINVFSFKVVLKIYNISVALDEVRLGRIKCMHLHIEPKVA